MSDSALVATPTDDSIVLSFGYTDRFSTNTGVDFSRLGFGLVTFFGRVIWTDIIKRIAADIMMKKVFHEPGTPKNGIRKIKIDRKNVFFLVIIVVIIHA